jgi:predicted nucleic-acid-binding protein
MEKTALNESLNEELFEIDDEDKMEAAVKEYEDSDDDFGPF